MKITLGEEYKSNVNGTSVDVCIDALATSDDEKTIILERTLQYGVNTESPDWRVNTIADLKAQALKFQSDAEALVEMDNVIMNISSDVAKELP